MGGPERKSKQCSPQTTNHDVQPRLSHWTIPPTNPSFFSPAALPSPRRLPLYFNMSLAFVTAQLPRINVLGYVLLCARADGHCCVCAGSEV